MRIAAANADTYQPSLLESSIAIEPQPEMSCAVPRIAVKEIACEVDEPPPNDIHMHDDQSNFHTSTNPKVSERSTSRRRAGYVLVSSRK